mmetsp:Transcript_3844/g.14287  ORF Transcript_3844/g.14287 Transcript_3844/m.14287 type:complete len:670 (-) Transcript_3844:1047-3056(-)
MSSSTSDRPAGRRWPLPVSASVCCRCCAATPPLVPRHTTVRLAGEGGQYSSLSSSIARAAGWPSGGEAGGVAGGVGGTRAAPSARSPSPAAPAAAPTIASRSASAAGGRCADAGVAGVRLPATPEPGAAAWWSCSPMLPRLAVRIACGRWIAIEDALSECDDRLWRDSVRRLLSLARRPAAPAAGAGRARGGDMTAPEADAARATRGDTAPLSAAASRHRSAVAASTAFNNAGDSVSRQISDSNASSALSTVVSSGGSRRTRMKHMRCTMSAHADSTRRCVRYGADSTSTTCAAGVAASVMADDAAAPGLSLAAAAFRACVSAAAVLARTAVPSDQQDGSSTSSSSTRPSAASSCVSSPMRTTRPHGTPSMPDSRCVMLTRPSMRRSRVCSSRESSTHRSTYGSSAALSPGVVCSMSVGTSGASAVTRLCSSSCARCSRLGCDMPALAPGWPAALAAGGVVAVTGGSAKLAILVIAALASDGDTVRAAPLPGTGGGVAAADAGAAAESRVGERRELSERDVGLANAADVPLALPWLRADSGPDPGEASTLELRCSGDAVAPVMIDNECSAEPLASVRARKKERGPPPRSGDIWWPRTAICRRLRNAGCGGGVFSAGSVECASAITRLRRLMITPMCVRCDHTTAYVAPPPSPPSPTAAAASESTCPGRP